MSENIVLVAFEQADRRGVYNVWRYSPSTECVAWGIEASSSDDAVKKARELIERLDSEGRK